ncbi:MAG TPA: sigma-70 family RNA polymerase sigma factor [Bryobacteraceae bacterium]|jgi:RNA polymerase sigma-70 factor (ECF subfamily)
MCPEFKKLDVEGVLLSDPVPPLSDAQLQTSGEAQTEFVRQNLRRIFLLIYRIVGNVDDAQDLTQETFIKALQRHGQLKDLERAGQWLSRIAANTAIDFLRRKKKLSFTDVGQLAGFATPWDDPEESLLRGERKLHLDGGLAVLTERERMALLLRDVEDMPADQVAAHMQCSMATVRSHIANARTKFKRYLEERKPS